MSVFEVQQRLQSEIEELTTEFAGIFSPETVEATVVECYQQLAETATIPNFLPTLTARFARDRLRATAQVEGKIVSPVPEVLFVCVHNAGRSQMAAALLDHHTQGKVHVLSAGSQPASTLNPAVVEAMSEVGLDISKEFPKPLTDDVVRAADVVVTMGCGDACPLYPGKRYLDWELEDPEGKSLETVRRVRDEIDEHVRTLIGELAVASG
jgi:arsenate reductase (thioredoxin)